MPQIKTAVSQGSLLVPKSRSGRRSMGVATLLNKELNGTLYKKLAGVTGVLVTNDGTSVLRGRDADYALNAIERECMGDTSVLRGINELLGPLYWGDDAVDREDDKGEIPTADDDDEVTGTESHKIAGVDVVSFIDELCKLAAAPITREEAEGSLRRLQQMEENRGAGTTGRAAIVGAAFMPVAGALTRTVAGTQGWLKPQQIASGVAKNPIKAVRAINWAGIGRKAAGDAAGGAILGGVLPVAREAVERKVESERLKDFIAQETGNRRDRTAREHVARHLGV